MTTDLHLDARVLGADGAERSFEVFYAEHHGSMLGLAYALTGSWNAAEDLAQEAFVRVLRDWHKVRHMERPDAWVRRIVVNLSTSRFRRLGSEARALARLASRRDQDEVALPADSPADFWDAVRRLPRRQGQAIALHYIEDLPVDEVAAAMGCAVGTAKAHLHAARAALGKRLAMKEHNA